MPSPKPSALKLWLMRLFNVPFRVDIRRIEIEGDPVQEFTLDHWQAIAETFRRVEGLRDCLMNDFDSTLGDLAKELAGAKNLGELIRLSQKTVDLWGYLSMPKKSVAEVNKIRDSQRQEQMRGKPVPVGAQTVM